MTRTARTTTPRKTEPGAMRWSFLPLVPAQHWPDVRAAVARLASAYRRSGDERPHAVVVSLSGMGEPLGAPVLKLLAETPYGRFGTEDGLLLVVAEIGRAAGVDFSLERYPRR